MQNQLLAKIRTACLAASCILSCGIHAAEKTITVPAGETIGLDAALAAAELTLENNDTLVKTGAGRLTGSETYKDISVNLRITEGIFEVNKANQIFKGGLIAVRNGATLDVNNTGGNSVKIITGRDLYLRGAGSPDAAVTENGRTVTGALIIRGNMDYQVLEYCKIWADGGDMTIASVVNGNNGVFSYGWIGTNDGKEHDITLLGPGCVMSDTGEMPKLYEQRFRYGYGFTNMTGRIILDGVALTAHNVNYKTFPGKFEIVVKNAGAYGQEGDSFGKCISHVSFECGTFVAGDVNPATITMPPFTGFPALAARMNVTVNDDWFLPSDEIAEAHYMKAFKTLTFGSNAKVVLKNPEVLNAANVYTIASSTASVAGTPPAVEYKDKPCNTWRTRFSTDSKNLELYYVAPVADGLVNVINHGILPGVENAAANDAAFATMMSSLGEGTHTIFFPGGKYYFTTPLAIANAQNFTLCGEAGISHVCITDDAEAAQILSVTGGGNVTVRDLVLANCAGLAIDANGTSALAVSNVVFSSVGGAIADVEGAYPVRATDCADVTVCENLVAGGAVYAAHLFTAGTTTVAELEPDATKVYMYAQLDTRNKYATRPFAEALAERGLSEFPTGVKLVKRGLGKLGGPDYESLTIENSPLGQIEVAEGTYVATKPGAFGRQNNVIRTGEEGSILIENANTTAQFAQICTFILKGIGAQETDARAPLCMRAHNWQLTDGCTFKLESDATIRTMSPDTVNGIFSYATLDQQGHTLTIKGENGKRNGIRFRLQTKFKNPAPIIVNNASLQGSYIDNATSGYTWEGDARPPLVKVDKTSELSVYDQAFADIFEVYEFEPGAWYNSYNDKLSMISIQTGHVKGAPDVREKVSLTITNIYTACAAHLLAGKNMTAAKTLTFGPDCVLEVEGVETLPAYGVSEYVLATSNVAIVNRPKVSPALKAAKWTTELSADGKTLFLRRIRATCIIIR